MDNIVNNDFSDWNIGSIVHFIKNNIIQLLLLILVFVIIYVVDHIANLNAMLYAMPLPNMISSQQASVANPRKKSKQSKQ